MRGATVASAVHPEASTSTSPSVGPSPLRRVAAALALLFAVVAIGVVLAFTVIAYPDGILATVATLLALAVALLAVVRRGFMRWLGFAIAISLLVFAAVLLIDNGVLLWSLAFFASAACAAGYARIAHGADRRTLRAAATPGIRAPAANHPALIINPWSGNSTMERTGLVKAALDRGIETVVLAQGDDLRELAVGLLDGGADAIGMAGGDGSQAIVASVAAERNVPFVCVPAGTRNHLALDLGVDRADVIGALDAFHDGVERRIDLATVNGHTFVNNVSLGIYANIVSAEGYRDAKLGTTVRLLPEMLGPQGEPFDLQFHGPDGTKHEVANVILVSNNPYSLDPLDPLGGFGSRPTIASGQLGISIRAPQPAVTVSEQSRRRTLGRQRRRSIVWMADDFVVASGGPVEAGVDGEAITFEPPLRFAIIPKALRVLVARSHPGVSPSASHVKYSGSHFGRLVRIALGSYPS